MVRVARTGLVVATCLAAFRPAWARELCAGPWSLLRPVPDECLEPIETDRPHLTDSPHPVPAGHAQLESGLAILELDPERATRLLLFEQMYKLGLVTGVDLQVLVTHAAVSGSRLVSHPSPLTLRAKLVVWEGKGAVPWITLVPVLDVPVRADQALRGGGFAFLGWSLTSRLELEVNLGALSGEEGTSGAPRQEPEATEAPVEFVAASALTMDLFGSLGGFAECFVVGTPDITSLLLGTGFVYALHRDVQLDLGSYIGLRGAPLVAPFVGISLRL